MTTSVVAPCPSPNGIAFKWKEEIQRLYYDAKNPGSFYGPAKLYRILKKKDPSCRLSDVTEWMRKQECYNIHRSRKHRFERRLLVRLRPYETLSMDVIFLQDFNYENGNQYSL